MLPLRGAVRQAQLAGTGDHGRRFRAPPADAARGPRAAAGVFAHPHRGQLLLRRRCRGVVGIAGCAAVMFWLPPRWNANRSVASRRDGVKAGKQVLSGLVPA